MPISIEQAEEEYIKCCEEHGDGERAASAAGYAWKDWEQVLRQNFKKWAAGRTFASEEEAEAGRQKVKERMRREIHTLLNTKPKSLKQRMMIQGLIRGLKQMIAVDTKDFHICTWRKDPNPYKRAWADQCEITLVKYFLRLSSWEALQFVEEHEEQPREYHRCDHCIPRQEGEAQ